MYKEYQNQVKEKLKSAYKEMSDLYEGFKEQKNAKLKKKEHSKALEQQDAIQKMQQLAERQQEALHI